MHLTVSHDDLSDLQAETNRPVLPQRLPSCVRCRRHPLAPCAGQADCHGFSWNCDCPRCSLLETRLIRDEYGIAKLHLDLAAAAAAADCDVSPPSTDMA